MLRAGRGGDAVRHREDRPESIAAALRPMVRGVEGAPTLVDRRPGARALKRDQSAQVGLEMKKKLEGSAAPPDVVAFGARGSQSAPGPVGVTPPLPGRLAQCLERCRSGEDAHHFP